jgi:ATP-binding cassette subfamily B protein
MSTLVGSDDILVVDRGQSVDLGRHDDLLARCDSYRHLWQRQMKEVA